MMSRLRILVCSPRVIWADRDVRNVMESGCGVVWHGWVMCGCAGRKGVRERG